MTRTAWGRAVTLLLGLVACPARAQLVGPPVDQPHVAVVKDFVDDFAEAVQTHTLPAVVNPQARSDQVIVPAINLHPTGKGESIVSFERVPLPAVAEGERLFLLWRMGLSDGIRWDHDPEPNGVAFSVRVDGADVATEVIAEGGWRSRAAELTDLAGRSASLAFVTAAIDGNTAYDWALFGRPQLIRPRLTRLVGLPAETVGLAFAEVECTQPAEITLSIGDAAESTPLPVGRHWLPLRFAGPAEPRLGVASGLARLGACLGAPLGYRVELREVAASSPFLLAEEPFVFTATLENVGEGRYPGGEAVRLEAAVPPEWQRFTGNALGPRALPAIRPGGKATVTWEGLVAEGPGRLALGASLGAETRHIALRAFPSAPARPAGRPSHAVARARPRPGVAGIVGNGWSRLSVIAPESGGAYAIAETWNGNAWQRVGSLYPLARLVLGGSGGRRELPFTVETVRAVGSTLVVEAQFVEGEAAPRLLRLRLTPDATAPRIALDYELTTPEAAELLAFHGPTVLAGDRAFGAQKDFAIFPGLEYLEGPEESSSTRDLAPPLNDRRVPAAFRVATPLMAVQGQDALVALLWDADQEWAPRRRRPAAQFLAPSPGAGEASVRMTLFAPSVGRHVAENDFEATEPYAVRGGQTLTLAAHLVLDHRARHDSTSVVNGPHRGGLVLQAMQHWFDAYGLPAPSPQPRSWEAERSLSREAYLTTLWDADPPGWRGHTAAASDPGLDVAPGGLLDLAEGVPPEVEGQLRPRLGLVLERALREQGSNAFLASNRVELGFFLGRTPEALKALRGFAESLLANRENGLWVWRPGDREHRTLGVPGAHTLGQAAFPSLICLRAARYTGDADLAARALAAMRQMEQYQVPRGASMWECPQFQPDLLAAALAIRAYCEAYRLTGDRAHLDHARYWAWTGLPFLYTWQLPNRPTMLYNSIGVMGSTYYTHSWLGRPVVWMGLDYAYALQDLAEFDRSFPWLTLAQGITNSALWQQYTEGPSQGLYPDSWELSENHPNPSDLSPLLILLNEYRLRGKSMHTRSARVQVNGQAVAVASGADILKPRMGEHLTFALRGIPNLPTYTAIAPVPEPQATHGAGRRAPDSAALDATDSGWLYDAELRAVILRHTMTGRPVPCSVSW